MADGSEPEFDYIVVGAGAAGSVLAAKLSEQSELTVLLIEAGSENPQDIGRSQGAFFFTWGTDRDWSYSTTPQPGLNGRVISHPRGRVVGGSTALNVGAWLRGRLEDYDAWQSAGADGWDGDGALRVFRQLERTDRGPSTLRGGDGPIAMSDIANPAPLADTLLDAYVEAGFGSRGDSNGSDAFVSDRYQTIFVDGVRRTIADAVLPAEVRARGSLSVRVGTQVTRVVFDADRAVGVEVATADGGRSTIRARREVILAGGAFNTPQLLMLSGIGPRAHLEANGIDVLVDRPAVGSGLRDHLSTHSYTLAAPGVGGSVPARLDQEALDTWTATHAGPAAFFEENGVGWASLHPGGLPDFELLMSYNTDAASFPDVADAAQRSGVAIGTVLLQPSSVGTVRLASADPFEKPIVDPAYLSADDDLPRLVAAVRIAHRILGQPSLAPWAEAVSPPIGAGDDEIEAHIRANASTVFHPIGTARMGRADDPLSVVDPALRVIGVTGLRVADASVMPLPIRGHTMAPSVFIGYRAAELIVGA